MGKQKKPVVGKVDASKKVPGLPRTPRSSGTPRWLFSRLDLEGCADGLFGWRRLTSDQLLDLLTKIQNWERATWQALEARPNNQGSHFLTYEKLGEKAKERIAARRIQETDCIFSLRGEGMFRVIGLRFEDDFFVVWFDPDHKFCPTGKR